MPEVHPTRQKLLEAGMALFAEKGFTATRVGDIEKAAGLQPRRGALYNHFESKEHLLEEAVREYVQAATTGSTQIAELELQPIGVGDLELLRPLIRELGRWFLETLDRQRNLVHVLEHDGSRLVTLSKQVRQDIVEFGNATAARMLHAAVPGLPDPEAIAATLLNSLVGLRRTTWTFGESPLGIDDRRAIETWSSVVLAVAASGISL